MSADDRPATKAFRDRWNNLLAFWKERRRGSYDKDFTEWRIEMGLTPRTAKENYWNAGETLGKIRIVFEKNQRFWEFCDSPGPEEETATQYMQRKTAEKKRKLSALGKDWFEHCRIKDEMMAGPCKDECSAQDKDCRYCDVYTGLHRFFPLGDE
jgi:hypothetical protein